MPSSVPIVLGTVAAIFTTAAFLPQVLHIWRSRSVAAISAWMYSIFALGTLLWIVYGMLISAWPIILANSVTALQAITILWFKVRYSRFDVRTGLPLQAIAVASRGGDIEDGPGAG